MVIRSALLAAALLFPVLGLAQTEELSPPPLLIDEPAAPAEPAEPAAPAEAPAAQEPLPEPPPPDAADSQPVAPEPEPEGPGYEPVSEPDDREYEAQEARTATLLEQDASRRPMRLVAETLGGAAGTGMGALAGFLIGAGVGCAGGGGGYCGLWGFFGAIPGAFLGLGLGTWAGGALLGGQGTWWAPLLGGAVGSLATGLFSAVLVGWVSAIPFAVAAFTVIGYALPVAGAVIAYELSHRVELQRSLVPRAVVPILTPQQRGLAFAWAF